MLKLATITHDDHYVEECFEPVLLRPVYESFNPAEAVRKVREAYGRSAQLAILLGLYCYCRREPRGARPRELRSFLSDLGIRLRDNYLRAELSYLHRKRVIVKRDGRYKIRDDLGFEDLERLVDVSRSRAGRRRWLNFSKARDWRPKHSLDPKELLQKYNISNLREHIKSLITKNELRALATLIYLAGGLRPSDRIVEIGYRDDSFYMVIYEHKLNRYRLVCEEYDELWRDLLRDEEIRKWLVELIKRRSEWILQWLQRRRYRWRISRDEWNLIASNVRGKEKKNARRIYLAYQLLGGQAVILTLENNKPLVLGVHLDPNNDEYYVR
mgnify:CR=1 FL=1